MEIILNKIYNLDCILGLSRLKESSIDMVLTSPPDDNIRNYKNNAGAVWGENIWKPVLKELYRVLKNGSVAVWVVGDATIGGSETGTSFKQALYAKDIGFNLHDTMIYQKQTPIPQFKAHRYTNSFEYMFIFSKGSPQRGSLIEVPTKCNGRIDKNYRGQVNSDEKYIGRELKVIKSKKLKTNIWTYSQNNGIDRRLNHKGSDYPCIEIGYHRELTIDPYHPEKGTGDYFRVAPEQAEMQATVMYGGRFKGNVRSNDPVRNDYIYDKFDERKLCKDFRKWAIENYGTPVVLRYDSSIFETER